jgi:hypothetical protein
MREPIPIKRKRGWNLVPGANGKTAEPTREYHRTRLTSMKKDLPGLLARIVDDTIPRDDLHPLEIAAREYRQSLLRDLGGSARATAVQRSLVTLLTGSWILLSTVDSYLINLAVHDGLINRKYKRVVPVVDQRMKIAERFARQLQALGSEKQNPLPGGINVERAVVLLPDNHRDQLSSGGPTNGQHAAHRSPAPQSPPIATVELPPRDGGDFISPNRDQPHNGDDDDSLERDLGLT